VSHTLIDWSLCFIAVALTASLMALQTRTDEPSQPSTLAARTLELPARLYDAQEHWSPKLKEQIGLLGQKDKTPADILDETHKTIREEFHDSWRMRLVAAAMAISYELNDRLPKLLPETPPEKEKKTFLEIKEELTRLSQGRPAQDISTLTKALEDLGSSRWLSDRVKARHLILSEKKELAEATLRDASDNSASYIIFLGLIGLISIGLAFLGLISLAVFPSILKRLSLKGPVGIAHNGSPFDQRKTTRVMACWFIGFILIQFAVSALFSGLGRSHAAISLNILTSVILQGAMMLLLLQHVGRKSDEERPLNTVLGLKLSLYRGRKKEILFWTIGGAAFTTFCAFVVSILNGLIFDSSSGSQSTVELFARAEGFGTMAMLVAAVAIFAPLFEEIVFRGFLFRNLRDYLGTTGAVLLSALLFGLAHMDLQNLIPLTTIGICLALLYEYSGSLLVPILVHAIWNAMTVLRIGVFVGG
jgi:membrane protease YdiL (CAAX protease family)